MVHFTKRPWFFLSKSEKAKIYNIPYDSTMAIITLWLAHVTKRFLIVASRMTITLITSGKSACFLLQKFWRFLLRKNLPTSSLQNLKIAVLGLGDSSYIKWVSFGPSKHLFKAPCLEFTIVCIALQLPAKPFEQIKCIRKYLLCGSYIFPC